MVKIKIEQIEINKLIQEQFNIEIIEWVDKDCFVEIDLTPEKEFNVWAVPYPFQIYNKTGEKPNHHYWQVETDEKGDKKFVIIIK